MSLDIHIKRTGMDIFTTEWWFKANIQYNFMNERDIVTHGAKRNRIEVMHWMLLSEETGTVSTLGGPNFYRMLI